MSRSIDRPKSTHNGKSARDLAQEFCSRQDYVADVIVWEGSATCGFANIREVKVKSEESSWHFYNLRVSSVKHGAQI